MDGKTKKVLFAAAAVIIIAVVLVVILTSGNKEVSTKEGVAYIQSEENQDIAEVEAAISQVNPAPAAALAESEEEDTPEIIEARNYREIFSNAVIMGDSIAESIMSYEVLDSSSVVAEIGVNLHQLDGALDTVTALHPSVIFLYYGFNDVVLVGYDYQKFHDDYTAFVEQLKARLPDARIYANALFPVINTESAGGAIYGDLTPYSDVIRQICDEQGLTYIDCTDLVEEQFYEPDGYHFIRRFYPYWLTRMARLAGLL